MKLRTIASLSVALIAIVMAMAWIEPTANKTAADGGKKILYYACRMDPSVKSDEPGKCRICGMDLTPVYADDAATNAPSSSSNGAAAGIKAKPYPMVICVVDGMKLGSMGEPYVFVYQGQEIKFCCAACKPDFLKNPAEYLKKIQDAEKSSSK